MRLSFCRTNARVGADAVGEFTEENLHDVKVEKNCEKNERNIKAIKELKRNDMRRTASNLIRALNDCRLDKTYMKQKGPCKA